MDKSSSTMTERRVRLGILATIGGIALLVWFVQAVIIGSEYQQQADLAEETCGVEVDADSHAKNWRVTTRDQILRHELGHELVFDTEDGTKVSVSNEWPLTAYCDGDHFSHYPAWGNWYVWDGETGKWRRDTGGSRTDG